MEAHSSTLTYMSLVKNRAFTHPHTLSHPDRHRFRDLLVTEKTGLYFSGVLGGPGHGGRTDNQGVVKLFLLHMTKLSLRFIKRLAQITGRVFVWTRSNSPKTLCPPTHTLTGSVCIAPVPSEEQSNQGNYQGKELHYSPNNKLQDPTDCKITFFNFRGLLPAKTRKTK